MSSKLWTNQSMMKTQGKMINDMDDELSNCIGMGKLVPFLLSENGTTVPHSKNNSSYSESIT